MVVSIRLMNTKNSLILIIYYIDMRLILLTINLVNILILSIQSQPDKFNVIRLVNFVKQSKLVILYTYSSLILSGSLILLNY